LTEMVASTQRVTGTGRPSRVQQIVGSLNPQQLEAVTHGNGPMLVFAGAGSGKTRVLTHRIAYLIDVRGVSPYNILAVTFTNKAAGEMKERVQQLVGREAQWVTIGTFHSVCARLLRRERDLFHLPDFTIYDTDDQHALVKQAMTIAAVPESRAHPNALLAAISSAKNELIDPDTYQPSNYFEELVRRVYPVYQDLLRQNHAYDFDDLIMETVRYLQTNPQRLEHYASRYQHILVDEYQDTNHAQYVLVRLLASKHGNLFVVGDADQAIYGWRGADIRNILEFDRDFPNAHTITLDQNYRSTQNILDAADSVIALNRQRRPKKLWTQKERGHLIRIFQAYNESEEAQFVVNEIRRLVMRGEVQPNDCVVMYRTNAQSRALEDAFLREGMPYRLVGATRFYERREVKDILAYLRVLVNPADSMSLRRIINVPPRKIGVTTIAALQRWSEGRRVSLWQALQEAEQNEDIGAAAQRALQAFAQILTDLHAYATENTALATLDYVLERTGYERYIRDGSDEGEDRWSNLMELRTVAHAYAHLPPPEGLRELLESVALVSEADEVDERQPATTLMTLHCAKGLEFNTVFIVGMEEGLFPHARSLDDPDQMEEERRLCYVGITRACERLYLVHATSRMLYGRDQYNAPSRFLLDIPEALVAFDSTRSRATRKSDDALTRSSVALGEDSSNGSVSEREPPPITTQSFFPGEKVRHQHFGVGVVVASELSGDDEEVTVEFQSTKGPVRKRLSVRYAGLEHID
jgi:DNA helicase-2/ATP-dependent DNA helicase PcrA